MTTAQNKINNKVKYIPTELNYFYNTQLRINQLKKQGNKSRVLIIALIIWNLILTMQVYKLAGESIIPPYNLPVLEEIQ